MKTSGLTREETERIVNALRAHGVRYALVFGSAARDALTADSDLDVAVSMDEPMSSAQRIQLIGALATACGRPIDLVDLRSARGTVFARALQGRELFCDSIRAKGEAFYRRVSLIDEDIVAARESFALARPRMFR